MASPIESLEAVIYTKLTGDTGTGKLMSMVTWAGPEHAPPATAYPLLTYALAEPPQVINMIGARGWWRFKYRFTVYASQAGELAPDKGVGQAAIARVITLFDRVALTVTGYAHIQSVIERPYAEGVVAFGGKAYVGISADLTVWLQ